jgi:hypothetical protein
VKLASASRLSSVFKSIGGASAGESVGVGVGARPLNWPSSSFEDGTSAVPLSANGDVEGGVERDAAKRLPEGLGLMLQVDASASSTSAAKDFEGSAEEGDVEKGLPERSELTSGVEASAASARSYVKDFDGSVEGDVKNSDDPVGGLGEDVENRPPARLGLTLDVETAAAASLAKDVE